MTMGRDEAPLRNSPPSPLMKERGINPIRNSNGIKGVRLISSLQGWILFLVMLK